MRYYHEKRVPNILVFSVVLSAFLFFFAPVLQAQQNRSPAEAASERMRQRQLRQAARAESNLMISDLEKKSKQPVEDARLRLDYIQIKQDFEQIQTVNNRMMLTTFSNNVLDYKRISEASTDIRKRANRLKSNLPLPESEKDKGDEQALKGWNELDQGDVKPALLTLDDLIMRFVTNPVFQSPEVVDVQLSSKAKRDLEDIIKLSAKIKKSAEKLSKTND